jgi:hypothetical protein
MSDQQALSKLAEQILDDAILLRKLSDRVYQLMCDEIRNQCDRTGGRRIL